MKKQIHKTFGWCPNNIINDPSLSLKAKGLWLYLNSKPEKWNYTLAGTAKQSKDGVASIRSAERELIDAGLIKVEQKRDGGKFSQKEYVLYDLTVVQFHDNGKTDNVKTDNVKTDNVKSHISKKDIVRKIKKERYSKKEIDKVIDFLNEIWSRNFKKSDNNRKLISSRAEDYNLETVGQVIQFKGAEWIDTEMEKYLRPSTIFNKSKFANYVEQMELFKKKPETFPKLNKKLKSHKRSILSSDIKNELI